MQHALVVGASRGMGREMVSQLCARGVHVTATVRERSTAESVTRAGANALVADLQDDSSLAQAAVRLGETVAELDLVVCTAGLLHDGPLQPEKRLADVDPSHLARLFAVNATGPLLVAKHFLPLMRKQGKAVFASLSARVGSIEDNRLGGWYGYRASKAAQNMFMRSLAVETSRRAKSLIVMSLHPGTVDTELSAPFQRHVPEHKLFPVTRACGQLLDIIDRADASYHGSFRAWDDSPIPW